MKNFEGISDSLDAFRLRAVGIGASGRLSFFECPGASHVEDSILSSGKTGPP
jgi:hypothetical protein